MVFKKIILISNDIWEKVKSNNNNFSSIKKKKKKSSAPPIKKPKLQEEQKQKLLTIPKHSIRYELNERAKECRKKSNIMKNAKILAKGIRADEEILKFFRPNEKPFIYVVPPQSWGDRSDTKHSKCLLLGGRRLNQLTLIPKPKGSGGARAAMAQVGPANKRNDTKRCLPIEASLRPGEAIPW